MNKSKKGVKFDGYTNGWYDFDTEQVCFSFWKNTERMARRFDFDWYFYLEREEAEKVACGQFDSFVTKVEPCGKFVKVFMSYYGDERKEFIDWLEKKGAHPLEADVYPVDRYIYDNQIEISDNPRILFYDIETDTEGCSWAEIEKHKILSIAFGETKDSVHCWVAKSFDDEGEAGLVDKFLDVIGGYDLIVGWNTSSYDEIVLKARAKEHRLYVDWKTINCLDMMSLFKRYYMRDATGSGIRISFSLENISKTVLGKGKVENVPVHKLKEFFIQNREKAIEYNKVDVIRLIELEEKLRYIRAHTVLAKICNRFINDKALKASVLVDGFVLKYASQEANMHFRTKRYREEEEAKPMIEGAFVMDPILGMHEGICDLDFSSLYPSIVIAFNISPETRLPLDFFDNPIRSSSDDFYCYTSNGVYFRTDVEGIFPAISRIALQRRQEFKDEAIRLEKDGLDGTLEHIIAKQTSDAWKVLANSMFGVMASAYGRYGEQECGEAITKTGQFILQRIIKLSETKGIPVVYGDTDSTFNKCTNAIAVEFAEMAKVNINEWLREVGAKEDLFTLKLDAEFLRIFFTAKKRYAGKKTTGKWEIRGLELIRSDGCKYMREMQRRMITYLLESENPNPKMARSIIEKWAHRLFAKEVEVEDLLQAQSLGKPISEYTGNILHVRIAKELLKKGKEIYTGMKIPYVIIGKKDGRLDAIHVDDFEGNYDADLYWKNKIYPPTKRILDACFAENKIEWKQLENCEIGGIKQKDLFIAKNAKKEPVEIQLLEEDQPHLQSIKDICMQYPGEHPLKINLAIPGSEVVLLSELRVRFVPKLIVEMEKIISRRIYYDKENWD